MDTLVASRFLSPISKMAAHGLLSLVAVALAAGCGELPAPEATAMRQATSAFEECPSGNCTDPKNAKGLFVAEDLGYCIHGLISGEYFCPEFFTDDQGDAALVGQYLLTSAFPAQPQYITLTPQGSWAGLPVQVRSIRSTNGTLVITVAHRSTEYALQGLDLQDLVLTFNSTQVAFLMRIRSAAAENGLPVYRVEYSQSTSLGKTEWSSYCRATTETAAFLPDRTVNSVTGQVEDSPGEVTMACRSGAIATCLVWGYRPWAEMEDPQQADALYRSCLHAKRAAYFVQSQDFDSYTVSGTSIAVQDNAGIRVAHSVLPGVEAIWGPQGAECFSPEFRRIPASSSVTLPALPHSLPVPECDEAVHEAARQGQLSTLALEQGWLITAPVVPSPS